MLEPYSSSTIWVLRGISHHLSSLCCKSHFILREPCLSCGDSKISSRCESRLSCRRRHVCTVFNDQRQRLLSVPGTMNRHIRLTRINISRNHDYLVCFSSNLFGARPGLRVTQMATPRHEAIALKIPKACLPPVQLIDILLIRQLLSWACHVLLQIAVQMPSWSGSPHQWRFASTLSAARQLHVL